MIPNTIESIEDIQSLVKYASCCHRVDWKSYGDVSVKYNDRRTLMIFNYTAKAQHVGRWNFFERVSRGLILNWRTGEVVARPFDKFFNLSEPAAQAFTGDIVSVTEKVDGSLGILYRVGSEYKIATRGSFESEQALWATRWLNENVNLAELCNDWTLLFEIVYPENRIVVDYEDFEGLILLAIRNRRTGDYLSHFDAIRWAGRFGVRSATEYIFESIVDIVDAAACMDYNREGYVVVTSTGQRFKVKSGEYVKMHGLVSGLSKKSVLKAIMDGVYFELIQVLPDEWCAQVADWKTEIDNKMDVYELCLSMAYAIASKKETRRDFALYVNEYAPSMAPYLFSKLDGKDYTQMLYRKMLKNA